MNYLILNKVRAVGVSREELFEVAKNILLRKENRILDLAELAVYLSPKDSQEFYCLFFFWKMPELEQLSPIFHFETPEWENRRQLIEQDFFKLIWEKRLVNTIPKASHLRILTFPTSYSEEKIFKQITYNRSQTPALPGFMGAWVGQWIDPGKDEKKVKILSRSDWTNIETQRAFFESEYGKNMEQSLEKAGVSFELASFDLRGIIQTPANE